MQGLAITFDLLANSENEMATSVLTCALDASQRELERKNHELTLLPRAIR